VAPSHQLTWDLTDALGGQASGVHLISDQPVTAAVTVTEASTVSVISAQPSVGGQVVAPTLAGTAWLANPTDQAINVDIKSDDGSGALQTSTVVVEPGRILGTPWPTAGSDVRLTPDSPQLRVSLTPNDKPTTVLTLTGGGSASSVALAGLDPGLG
jgi:hypothetical protein